MDQIWNLQLDDFPKEILELIISNAVDDTRKYLRLASTKWFMLVNYRQFSVKFPTEKTLPQVVDRLLQYHGPISLSLGKSRMRLGEHSAQLSRLTNLTQLNLDLVYEPNLSPSAWYGFTTLTNLREWRVPAGCPASVRSALINMTDLNLLQNNVQVLSESMKRMSYLERVDCHAFLNDSLDIYSLLPCPSRLTSLTTSAVMDHTNTSKLFNLRHIKYDDLDQNLPLKVSFDTFTALQSLNLVLGRTSWFDTALLPTTLTSLWLAGEGLSASHYEHLAQLHNIRELCIQAPVVNDEHYTWISHLTALETLNLWTSYPTSEHVVFTGAMLGLIKSSQLTELVIEFTPSMTLDHLSHLTSLQDMFVYENDQAPVEIDYSSISQLTRLTSLHLYTAYQRPSLMALTNLESLKRLNINNTKVPHVPLPPISFARLTSLESLNIEECEAVSVQSLSALSYLTCVAISSLPNINYEFLKALPLANLSVASQESKGNNFYSVLVQLTSLQSLAIRGLSASQVIGLSSLQGLKALRLSDTDTDRGQNVTHLTFLRELNLLGTCNITVNEGQQLNAEMTNLIDFTSFNF